MAHPRKLIRVAVVALLVAARTAAGSRVNPTRVEPHKKSQLPAIGVYTLSDSVDEANSTATEAKHELELEVVAWVGHTDSAPADDAMDDIAEQIENAMRSDPFLGGKAAHEVTFKGTAMEIVEDDGRSDPTVGIVVLTYSVKYFSTIVADAPTDIFRTAKVTDKLTGGVPDTAPSIDQYTVRSTS